MAKCVKKITTVVTESYTLEISREEAHALLAVLSVVGGSPEYTARGLISNIAGALRQQGATTFNIANYDSFKYGQVDFKEPLRLKS